MSNILKFKVWDSLDKRLYPLFNVTVDPNIGELRLPDRYSLMQYIGLNDKNQKEIYKGDIISVKYFQKFSNQEKEIKAEVKYINGCFGFYEYQTKEDSYFNNEWDIDKIEIIGNIFENPELLKDNYNDKEKKI